MAGTCEKDVLLGFKDEFISDKQKEQLNFTVNKFGGEPILPKNVKLDESLIKCPLCHLWRPLVVQIYAPLDEASSSSMDRILYLFACINPSCGNKNESWLCLRVQTKNLVETNTSAIFEPEKQTNDWCTGADDWGDDDDNMGNDNLQNKSPNLDNNSNNDLDDDDDDNDESSSLEESLRSAVNNLLLDGDKNANVAQGAERLNATCSNFTTTAEIEGGNESECISIDSPTQSRIDLNLLMQQTVSLPSEMAHLKPQFRPFFINVYEETLNHSNNTEGHIRELLQEYQRKEDLNCIKVAGGGGEDGSINAVVDEQYEESEPAHGDKLFHSFLSRIQANPGQILRYDRGGKPILLRPQLYSDHSIPKSCEYCKSEMVFEFQIISTVIPSLQLLIGDGKPRDSYLEFGTVLVYTCRNSCWDTSSSTRIEAVLLQTEVF